MFPFYIIIFGTLCMPFLFLWEQVFWLLTLYIISFWLFHLWGFYFLAYTLLLVYIGAIAILVVLSILMMNLHRAWHWDHISRCIFILISISAILTNISWNINFYQWWEPNWFKEAILLDFMEPIAVQWYNIFPGITLFLAWLLLIVTIGIVRSVTHKS